MKFHPSACSETLFCDVFGLMIDEDTMLARLLDDEAPSSQEEAEARRPYERLLAKIRALPDVEPRPGWEERARERWRHERRIRQRAAC